MSNVGRGLSTLKCVILITGLIYFRTITSNIIVIHQSTQQRTGDDAVLMSQYPPPPPPPLRNESNVSFGNISPTTAFGACLMMKNDNDLLYEWIAYHWTVLPLRYLVIGTDEGNTQDPLRILQRWDGTGLQYWVIPAEDFVNRHGAFAQMQNAKEDDAYHHHQFIHRQRGFITTCAQKMRDIGAQWVTFTDSDEFIVLNRFGNDDLPLHHDITKTNTSEYILRKAMSDMDSQTTTALDVITTLTKTFSNFPSCVIMPRLRFGAYENKVCTGSETVNQLAKTQYDYKAMSTLRYKQHAGKNNWSANRFGKVIVDISAVQNLLKSPKNIHRPFSKECPYPAISFEAALFGLNHYTASWERYSRTGDLRRTCEVWMKMADEDKGDSCDQHIHEWFPKFIQQVGTNQRAKRLLGVDVSSKAAVVSEKCPP